MNGEQNINNLIQVAGVIDAEEAAMLLSAGVDWLGFPLRLPVHQEDLTEAEAARIIQSVIPAKRSVLITYLDRAAAISEFCRLLHCDIVQLHGNISTTELAALRKSDPSLFIIKSLVVKKDNQSELENLLQRSSPYVQAYITDTHDPLSGADGATGKRHDWAISRRLVQASRHPVILAGGLNPENVAEAIRVVQPAGVDVHTGLEDPDGRKDYQKTAAFVKNAREAFAKI